MDLSAAHLRRLELGWNIGDDTEVLKTCLSIVSRCSSLEQLEVDCDTPGEHSLVAESPCSACCSFTLVAITVCALTLWGLMFAVFADQQPSTSISS